MLPQVKGSLVAVALLSTLVLQCSSTPIIFRDEALTGVRKLFASHESTMPTTVEGLNYMGSQTDGCDCCLWHCDETEGFFVSNYSMGNNTFTSCLQCEEGFFNQTSMECTDCTKCDSATEIEHAPCTKATDTVCVPCPIQSSNDCDDENYFKDATSDSCSVCADWSVCGDNEYEISAPNSTHDRVCMDCTVCDPLALGNETVKEECKGSDEKTDRTCMGCSACSCEGANFCVPCTASKDTSCAPFSDVVCVDGTSTANSWKTNDMMAMGECTIAGCGECDFANGMTVDQPCTTIKNSSGWYASPETCKACTNMTGQCTATEYMVACTAMEDTTCVPATTCTDGTNYETTPLTKDVNRVCTPCETTCTAGSYVGDTLTVGQIIDTTCTSMKDITCKTCTEVPTTVCNASGAKAQYIELCDGMNTDTTCEDCETCGQNQYTSQVCSDYSDTTCEDCASACTVGQFESTACTTGTATEAGANRVCESCTNGPTSGMSTFTSVGLNATSCEWECNANYYLDGNMCANCPLDSSSAAGSTSAMDCMCNEGFYKDGNMCFPCLDGMSSAAGSSSAMDCNVAIDDVTPDGFELCYNIPAGAKPVMAMTGVAQCTLFAENTTTDMCTRCKVDADCADNEELEGDCTNNEVLQELPACVPCDTGYMKVGTACSDIDECTNMDFMHNCGVGFACANTDGSFACNDVDECTTDGSCNAGEDCSNTVGSFSCACATGYVNTTAGGCADVNECTEGTHNCDATKDCNNNDGGFTCEVKPAAGKTKIMTVVFQLGGFDKADDVDDDTKVAVQEALATELGVAKSAVALSFNDARRRRLLAVSVTAAVTVAEDQADALKAKANANDFGDKVAQTANAKLPVDKQITVTGLQATVPDPIVDPIDSGAAISGPCHILNVLVALVAAAACLWM